MWSLVNLTPTLESKVSPPKTTGILSFHLCNAQISHIHFNPFLDIHFNQNRKLQKHIQQSTVCLQWHSFLRYNVAHCTILLSQQQFGHMHTHVHTHTDRLSICVGNDSPPPPGVEPSLSRLLPLHLCEPFTSLTPVPLWKHFNHSN